MDRRSGELLLLLLLLIFVVLTLCFNHTIINYLVVRVRVLGTDYGSSWVRELTWALLPGEELFAAAAADPHGNFGARSKIHQK